MFSKVRLGKQHILVFCAALCVLAAAGLMTFGSTRADALYIVTDDQSSILLDGSYTESTISQRLITVTDAHQKDPNIHLLAGQQVAIFYKGAQINAISLQETVSQLLHRMKIYPGRDDLIGVDGSGSVIRITISPEIVGFVHETEVLPGKVEYVDLHDQPAGYENILTAGSDGTTEYIYQVTYSAGKEVKRQLVDTLVSEGDVTVIERGTLVSKARSGDAIAKVISHDDGSGYLIMRSGDSLRYKSAMKVTATAYTTGYDGVGTRTATGTTVHVGSIAVDRKVIPLGSHMVVSTNRGSYVGKAEDTGVKGKKVDLYMNSYEQCIQFGRRGGTAYILA